LINGQSLKENVTPSAATEVLGCLFAAFRDYEEKSKQALETAMIRKLKSGGYRLYSRKMNPKTGKRRNLGTFTTRAEAEKHERAVQYFKRAHVGGR
jgi:hypothetical protein